MRWCVFVIYFSVVVVCGVVLLFICGVSVIYVLKDVM